MKPISSRRRRARATATVLALSPGLLLAQVAPPRANASSVTITGNPLRSADIAAPTSVLSGDDLVRRRGSTLGETLDGLPGVSSSWFGPNANRPMIRGQDSDRIRVLSNSGVALDASALSYDHAVPIDPLVVERIEVLRGPAALMYGGSAIGGVVNTIDNRIPKAAVDGVDGSAELRYGGPATERGASAMVEGGGKGFAVHADGFWRDTNDMKVPWYSRPLPGGGSERVNTILNSASRSYGGAVGGSMVWDQGFLGASVDTYRSDYGVVAEPDVTIDMFLNKLTLAGEVRDLGGAISAVSGHWLWSDYQHQELEGGGEVATTFKNRGSDLRLQAEHAKLAIGGGSLGGVFGLQAEAADFSALGEEAFVPGTSTRHAALFVLEEYSIGDAKLSLGGRLAHARIDSDGDGPGQSQFGPPQSRSFTPFSTALGGVYKLAPPWQLSANLAYTERAPTFFELYANGLHVATGAYEEGNPNLGLEKGTNLDVALAWKDGADALKAGAFASDFSNYIALLGHRTAGTHRRGAGAGLRLHGCAGAPVRLRTRGQLAPAGRQASARPGRRTRHDARHQRSHRPAAAAHPAGAADAGAELAHGRLDGTHRGHACRGTGPRAQRRPGDAELHPRQPVGELQLELQRCRRPGLRAHQQRRQRAGLQRHLDRHGAAAGTAARPRCDGRTAAEFLTLSAPAPTRRPAARRGWPPARGTARCCAAVRARPGSADPPARR